MFHQITVLPTISPKKGTNNTCTLFFGHITVFVFISPVDLAINIEFGNITVMIKSESRVITIFIAATAVEFNTDTIVCISISKISIGITNITIDDNLCKALLIVITEIIIDSFIRTYLFYLFK